MFSTRYIYGDNRCIKFITNDYILRVRLENEYKTYFLFRNEKINEPRIKIYAIKNKNCYTSINKSSNINLPLIKDNGKFMIIKKNENKVIIFYEEYNDSILEYIGEVIFSIFNYFLEQEGYIFFHAACVSIKDKAVAIIGGRHTGKSSILCCLLQSDFDFICNSKLAMKLENNYIKCIGTPSRVGIRLETLIKNINKKYYKQIVKTEGFKKISYIYDMNRKKQELKNVDFLNIYGDLKFNITVPEIQNIFNVSIIKEANLKLVIIPRYDVHLEKIKVKKLAIKEVEKVLIKNQENGIYAPIKYLNNFFYIKTNKIDMQILKKIQFIEIYQNERTASQLRRVN